MKLPIKLCFCVLFMIIINKNNYTQLTATKPNLIFIPIEDHDDCDKFYPISLGSQTLCVGAFS